LIRRAALLVAWAGPFGGGGRDRRISCGRLLVQSSSCGQRVGGQSQWDIVFGMAFVVREGDRARESVEALANA